MRIESIESAWAEATFPSVFQGFQPSALRRQMQAFNEIVEEREYSPDDLDMVYARLSQEMPSAHRPLLNILSMGRTADVPVRHLASLLLLETYLAESAAAGVPAATYRDMLRSPESYLDLLAELDWVNAVRGLGGTVQPHAPTDTGAPEDGNYDLRWDEGGATFRGDVKWFKDWLVKSRGESLLAGHVKLMRIDLEHDIIVKAPVRHLTVDRVIDAAIETVTLYEAAVSQRPDPRWVLGRRRSYVEARVRRAYEFPPPLDLLIEAVIVKVGSTYPAGRGHVSVIESGFANDEDQSSVRRNLLRAASQTAEPSAGDDISCVLIGSAAAVDASDVEAVLNGRIVSVGTDGGSVHDGTGLFDPRNPEPGFEHIGAVLYFSLNFEPDSVDPRRIHAVRTCRMFERPGGVNGAQRARLERLRSGYLRDTSVVI